MTLKRHLMELCFLKKQTNFLKFFVLSVVRPLQIVEMDLSSSIIPTSALESIICHCRLLEYLSLEGLQLSDIIIR